MPLFDYQCSCGCKQEILVLRRSEIKDTIECPDCRKQTFERVKVNAAALHFVGGGWPGQDMKVKAIKESNRNISNDEFKNSKQ